jgi:hypothetical protein
MNPPDARRGRRSILRCRADQVPFVAGHVEKHGDPAIGLGARRAQKLNARRCHPGIGRTEIVDVEEETHPARRLPADSRDRYSTLGFQGAANLDDGDLWPVSYALQGWSAAVEQKVAELVTAAIS